MFLSRLDNARNDMKEEDEKRYHTIPTSASKHKTTSNTTPSKTSEAKKQSPAVPQKRRNPKLLHELNEYLFDLFDSNCMEDFKRMEQFESYALDAFKVLYPDDDSMYHQPMTTTIKEFNHRQYELHQEFITLFESMIEKFLLKFHYTTNEFYTEIEWYIQHKDVAHDHHHQEKAGWKKYRSDGKIDSDDDEDEEDDELSPEQEAFEIIEVISFYTDFEKWSTMMMEIVKQRKQFETFKAKISKAVTTESELIANMNNALIVRK